jgi:hypothetical protein
VPEDFLVNQSIEDVLHSWDLRHQCWSSEKRTKACRRKWGLHANPWPVQKRNVDSVVLRNGMNWPKKTWTQ